MDIGNIDTIDSIGSIGNIDSIGNIGNIDNLIDLTSDDLNSHEHSHSHTHSNTKAVSNRLAKATGHLDSVKKMVDRGESCTDVLTQLIAVRSAINNAAKIIIVDHLNECIVDAAKNDDMVKIAEFEKIIKSFVK